MTLYPAFRCTLTVRIFLAMYWLVPCISPFPKSEASCAPALVEMLMPVSYTHLTLPTIA